MMTDELINYQQTLVLRCDYFIVGQDQSQYETKNLEVVVRCAWEDRMKMQHAFP